MKPASVPGDCPDALADSAIAALERLAAALPGEVYATTLTCGQGWPPHLAVAHRELRLTEGIYAQDGWYWWGWAERIAPITDPDTAARKVTSRLRAAPGPADG